MTRPGEPIGLGPRRQLFFDDALVEERAGLRRVVRAPRKRGAVLKAEKPWEGLYISTFSAPMWVESEGVFKQVYECRDAEERGNEGHRYAVAVSADGIAWERPELGLVDYGGSRANNLFPTPDGRRLVHVVHDPDDPDGGRRYKGLLTVPEGRVPVVSADGLHWRKLDALLPSGDAGTLGFDRGKRLFMAMLKRPNPATVGRSYDISLSGDFVSWSEPRLVFGMDRGRDQAMALETVRRRLADNALAKPLFVDPDPGAGWDFAGGGEPTPTWRAECYNFGVVPYEGIYLGLATVYFPTGQRLPERRNADGFNQVQLVASRDLKDWARPGGRQPFLETSPLTDGLAGNYDRLQLGAYNGLTLHGDEARLYYTGMKRRVPQHERWTDGTPRPPETLSAAERADWLEDTHSALCLATVPRDRFVALEAGADGGHLLTRPLRLDGDRLRFNLDAGGGEARVEAYDAESGAALGETTLRGDGTDTAAGLDLPRAGRLRLKITLRRAALYALWAD